VIVVVVAAIVAVAVIVLAIVKQLTMVMGGEEIDGDGDSDVGDDSEEEDDTDDFKDIGSVGDYLPNDFTVEGGQPRGPSSTNPAPLIGKWVAYRWQLADPRRGWFVGKVHSQAGDGDGEANYKINYSRRITGERTIDGLIPTSLVTSEHGTCWVLVVKRGY
jgi:hypothetical protein